MNQHFDTDTILLVCLIVWIIYKRTVKDNIMELKKLIILPALFIYLTYSMVTKHFALVPFDFVTIVIGMIIGVTIGFLVSSNTNIKADHEQKLIFIAGSWTNLIMVLIIVVIKFSVGYVISINPSLSHNNFDKFIFLILITVATGLMIGRYLLYYLKYVSIVPEYL